MIQRLGVQKTYSEIVIHNSTVYLSGQVPWTTCEGPFQEQAVEVFQLIEQRLQEAGSSMKQILTMQVFLKDPVNYPMFNKVFIERIPEGCAPARNTICGMKFPNPDWALEIIVTAAL